MRLSIYLLLLLTLCHCHQKKQDRNTLYIALDAEVKTLDPRQAIDANSMRVVNLLFSSLVQIGPELQVIPDAAYKWKQQGLDYIFYLKPLRFANGRAVTKEDLLFSFKEFQKRTSLFYSAFKIIRSVHVSKKEQNFILKITLKQFSATFLNSDLPVIKILPKPESQQDAFGRNPIGTGKFKIVHKNSRELMLKRVHLTTQKPNFLSFKFIRDSFTRTQEVLTGNIDIAPSVIPLDQIHKFSKDRFHILTQPGLSTTYLLLNLKNQMLKQKKVREALQLSISVKDIIKYKLKNYGMPALSLIQMKNKFFNHNLKSPSFDLNKSQTIIKDLNLQNKKLTLRTTNNQDSIHKVKILASQISRSGLRISIESYEWGTFYTDLNQGRYEMALMKWVGVTDPDIYRLAFHSENLAPKGRNRSFYKNQVLDQLLEQGLTLKNLKMRQKIYNKIQKHIADHIVIIPLWHNMEISIVKKNIKNYFVPMNGSFLFLEQAIKE